jgi:hypothetical protein
MSIFFMPKGVAKLLTSIRSCKIVNIYQEYVSNVWHKMTLPKIQIFIRLAVQRKISTGLFLFTRGLMSYSQALCLSCKIHTWKIWSRFKTQLFLFVGHPWSEFMGIPCIYAVSQDFIDVVFMFVREVR